MTRPLALTCGDPAGIGLELAGAAWRDLGGATPFVLLADPDHAAARLPGIPLCVLDGDLPQGALPADQMCVLPIYFAAPATPGQPDGLNAAGTITAIETAVTLVQQGRAAGVVTNPIAKSVLRDGAGFAFPGHTEFLAHLAGQDHSVMMLACDELKVVPATIHIALEDVPRSLTRDLLNRVIRTTYDAMRDRFGIANPRIAVAGLNPHAGENGMMGDQEITWIAPLLDDLRREGMNISGPLPADTMFHPAARKRYDVAVAMYHDQALIPIKTIDFSSGVNVTLGLPFIRTSPDHGTAFDIAGQGIADPSSLIAALKLAQQMAGAGRE